MSDISNLLKNAGIKNTKQRVTIIHALAKSKLPITAEELHAKSTDMSLSTIYRTLELFCEKGIVHKSVINDSDCYYYELVHSEHRHYAVCLACNEITHIDLCPLYNVNIDANNFTVTSHKLELYGYCDKCKNNAKGDNNETN